MNPPLSYRIEKVSLQEDTACSRDRQYGISMCFEFDGSVERRGYARAGFVKSQSFRISSERGTGHFAGFVCYRAAIGGVLRCIDPSACALSASAAFARSRGHTKDRRFSGLHRLAMEIRENRAARSSAPHIRARSH